MQVSTTRKTLSHLTSALRQARDGEDFASFWQDVYNYLLTAYVPLSTALQSIFAQAPKPVLPADLASKLYTKRKTLRGSCNTLWNNSLIAHSNILLIMP